MSGDEGTSSATLLPLTKISLLWLSEDNASGAERFAEEEPRTGETLTRRTFPSPLVTVTSFTGTIFVEFDEDDEARAEDGGEEEGDASLVSFDALMLLPLIFFVTFLMLRIVAEIRH